MNKSIAVGHSVRALYMYSGMADLALQMSDKELEEACETLFTNIVEKRMHISGGFGEYLYSIGDNTIFAHCYADSKMTVQMNGQDIKIRQEISGRKIPVITLSGKQKEESRELYRSYRKEKNPVSLNMIPYFAWANRGITEMNTWFLIS